MGCGASQRYEVAPLSGLEEERKPQAAVASSDATGDEKPTKYRPVEEAAFEGNGGDSELAKAVVAANDEKLLMKYAQSHGKRPGASRRVFAPAEHLAGSRAACDPDTGEFLSANHRVGRLRLSDKHAKGG
ncbi:unnamed protein product [Effrenium voratum]|nr:unnamed protein product [Effrenium voratum]